jgi:Homeodomain-like domain
MADEREEVVSPTTELRSAEESMLGAELVREMVVRRARGEGVKRIARELGVDRKTVKRWLRLGTWQPRQRPRRERQLDRFAELIERRAPEVGFNGVVLYRELKGVGFTGGLLQVQRFVRPYASNAAGRSWPRCGSRPDRASRPRSTTVSCGSGSARSRRRSICLSSRWAIRAGCMRGLIATNG